MRFGPRERRARRKGWTDEWHLLSNEELQREARLDAQDAAEAGLVAEAMDAADPDRDIRRFSHKVTTLVDSWRAKSVARSVFVEGSTGVAFHAAPFQCVKRFANVRCTRMAGHFGACDVD